VAPAASSVSAQAKKISRVTADGLPVQSFHTLLRNLATRCRNTCRIASHASGATFQQLTEATPLQSRALQLLGL
jgi:histone H3/H4